MPKCNHNCDTEDEANFAPDADHYLDCPVWALLLQEGK